MKEINLLLLLTFLILIGSCKDELNIQDKLASDNQVESDLRSGTIPVTPYFSHSFVADSLDISPRLELELPGFESLKESFYLNYLNDPRIWKLDSLSVFPAWNLAEPFIFFEGFIQYYVPVYDLPQAQLSSILIMRFEDSSPRFYMLWKDVITSIEAIKPSPFSDYWRGVFDYFGGELVDSKYEEVAAGMRSLCAPSTATGWCICTVGPTELCGDSGAGPCYGGCGTIGGDPPGGGITGVGDWGFHHFSNEVDLTWLEGLGGASIGTGGSGGTPPDTYKHELSPKDLPPFDGFMDHGNTSTWENYIKGFNCNNSLGFEDLPEGNDGDAGGGFWEIELILNEGSLFSLQLQMIIEEYNLDMSPEDIRDILETDCGLSLFNHVRSYVKYKLIDHLSEYFFITDQEKWALFDNFELYQSILDAFQSGTTISLPGSMSNIEFILELNQYISVSYEISSWILDEDSPENFLMAMELFELLEENPEEESLIAGELVLANLVNDNFYGPYDQEYFDQMSDITGENIPPEFYAKWVLYYSIECAILKEENEEWSDLWIAWEAGRWMLHLGLDLAGLVPGIGEVADITNGVIHSIYGEGLEASLSFASAIPIAGWYAAGIKTAHKAGNRFIIKDGIVDFGRRNSTRFRKSIGLQKGDPLKAHHLIPREHRIHDLLQKAAKSKSAFHIDDAANGLPLSQSVHGTGHSVYNAKVKSVLDDLNIDNPSIEDSYEILTQFGDYLKDLIESNPNLNLGEIANLIQYP